ncbi:hypothetical protein [Methylocapsa acidiphila]|uniref:hypothetical protein n=1 Tax=Methylocapsa acidiphila TaxID=133552 RepID=UPI0003FFE237|nr:hypothetical protein [Methylocapsa acidiphila]
MKIRALMIAGLMIATIAGPSIAFEQSAASNAAALSTLRGAQGDSLFQTISCNPNDEDKQAYCMRKCEEEMVDSSEQYHVTKEEAEARNKACQTKCGC